ncbi:hypothetical protein CAPTEDRAFT_202902 [Capitella teleta]|uniref:Secreted protein n=1 Tax=Capitella teleta TaxID=283909 RepID=R7U2X6_CAPTE|nr:hypothetical protein CAPTEDRAFT_202902 [Capitella teleta]|eukprot:ELT97535.1 hypothetical protein CAPTEDRAFT_202902 [Capitella teleta]
MERKIVGGLICLICLQCIQSRSTQEERGHTPRDITKTAGNKLKEAFGVQPDTTHKNVSTDTVWSGVHFTNGLVKVRQRTPRGALRKRPKSKRRIYNAIRLQKAFRKRYRMTTRQFWCMFIFKHPAENLSSGLYGNEMHASFATRSPCHTLCLCVIHKFIAGLHGHIGWFPNELAVIHICSENNETTFI